MKICTIIEDNHISGIQYGLRPLFPISIKMINQNYIGKKQSNCCYIKSKYTPQKIFPNIDTITQNTR